MKTNINLKCFLNRFVPESPRWLLTRGKFKKAYYVLKRIADSNKRKVPLKFSLAANDEMTENKVNRKLSITLISDSKSGESFKKTETPTVCTVYSAIYQLSISSIFFCR